MVKIFFYESELTRFSKEKHTFDKFWSLDINSQAKYEYQAVKRKVSVHKWCPSN